MTTRLELKTKIAADLHRSDLSTQIGDAITAAVTHYNRDNFWFMDGSASANTVASAGGYSIGNDLKQIEAVLLEYSGRSTPLEPITYKEYSEYDLAVTGVPSKYSIYNGLLLLYPVPNGAYPLRVSYQKDISLLSDSASNAWTNAGFELIRHRSEWDIYAHYLRNPEMAAMSKQSESEAFSSLLNENAKRISTGKLRKSGF